jgi:hypothetical protein
VFTGLPLVPVLAVREAQVVVVGAALVAEQERELFADDRHVGAERTPQPLALPSEESVSRTTPQPLDGQSSKHDGDKDHSRCDCGMKREEHEKPGWTFGEGDGPTRRSVALGNGRQLARDEVTIENV